jgi:methionine-rich copper-binding protein CopC
VVVATAIAVVVVAAPVAGAEATLEVTTPADGRYLPGQPTPLLVTIEADQAITGTLTAAFEGFVAGTQAVEVAGGSTKEVVFIVTAPPWSPQGSLTFVPDDGGETATTRVVLSAIDDDELVGVLGRLAERNLPSAAELTVDMGEARLFPIEPSLLSSGPDALALFSQVVSTADDLAALDESQLGALEAWVAGNAGVLVIDDPPGTAIPFGPVEADGGADRAWFGAGSIRYTDGRAAAGRYDGLLNPTPSRAFDQFPWGGGFGGGPITPSLARDAGVAVLPIGSLILMLLVYLVVAGPVLWLVLRRGRREPLLWLALPLLALVTTAGVYGVGRSLRDNASTAHATIVADLPHLRSVSTHVLVTSANGGTEGVRLDDGWRPASRFSEELMFFEGPFAGRAEQAATPTLSGRDLVTELPPGGVGVIAVEQTRAGPRTDPSWRVELATDNEGGLAGTITNLTGHDLEEVLVAAGQGFQRLSSVGAGETSEVTLRNTNVPPMSQDRLMERLWASDPWQADDGAVNPGALIDWLSRRPLVRSPGYVLVLGWTDDEAGPLETTRGATVGAGRTAFVTVERLDRGLDGGEPYRLELLRGWSTSRPRDPVPGNVCADFPMTIRLAMSDEIDPDRAVLDLSRRSVAAMDVWDGEEWQPAGVQDAEDDRVILAVPPTALGGGDLYLRILLGCDFWGLANPFPDLRPAQPGEAAQPLGGADSEDSEDSEEGADA